MGDSQLQDTKSPTLYHTNTQCLKSQDGGKGFMHDQTGGEKVKYVRKLLQETGGELFHYFQQQAADLSLPRRKLQAAAGFFSTKILSAREGRYSDQAVFVLLGDAGRALTEWHASELVSSYFEVINYQSRILDELISHCCADCQANADIGVDQEAPVPEALINTIGQRHKFSVKVTEHNLSGKTRALTVTEILPLDTPTKTETSE
ncbi:hypothetical protein YC2023_071515 [Brassica napus]